MEIITNTYFYNDVDALKKRLENNKEFGLTGIYADGPFPTFPHKSDKSDDGSRELIQSYDNAILIDCGVNHIPFKENKMLKETVKRGFKNAIVLGSDELIDGDLFSFLKNIDYDSPINRVPFEEHKPNAKWNRGTIKALPRLITKPGLTRLRDIHWIYFYCDKPVILKSCPITEGITIHHDNSSRPKERDEAMEKFQNDHVPYEYHIIWEKYFKQIVTADYPPIRTRNGGYMWTCGCIWDKNKEPKFECRKHSGSKKPILTSNPNSNHGRIT